MIYIKQYIKLKMAIILLHSSGWRADKTDVEIAKKIVMIVKKRRRTEKPINIFR